MARENVPAENKETTPETPEETAEEKKVPADLASTDLPGDEIGAVTFYDTAKKQESIKEISIITLDGRTRKVKPDKGAITTNDPFIAQRLASLADNPSHPLAREKSGR